jgi:hypothetical protein
LNVKTHENGEELEEECIEILRAFYSSDQDGDDDVTVRFQFDLYELDTDEMYVFFEDEETKISFVNVSVYGNILSKAFGLAQCRIFVKVEHKSQAVYIMVSSLYKLETIIATTIRFLEDMLKNIVFSDDNISPHILPMPGFIIHRIYDVISSDNSSDDDSEE